MSILNKVILIDIFITLNYLICHEQLVKQEKQKELLKMETTQ